MIADDFVYDGIQLSSKGYTICSFESSSGVEVVDVGSNITFNRVKRDSGRIYSLVSSTYEECVTATFDICKCDSRYNDMEISATQFRELMRWLNRREFLPFRIIDKNETSCWYNASFNIDKLIIGGRVCGLRLTMETDRPFGFAEPRTHHLKFGNDGAEIFVTNFSGEIGYLYPKLEIECLETGDLTITNKLEGCTTVIKNCTRGEVITLDGETQTITTTSTTHRVNDDFNWEFFRLGNTMTDKKNPIKASAPCDITLTYTPIVKDVP